MNNVGLVVLNYNSFEDTIYCVKKLASFDKGYHIIVVDNHSTDESVIKIETELSNIKNVDIIYSEINNGYSAGNNYGMKYAIKQYDVDVVGILNPDVIIPNENVIDKICEALFSDEQYAIAGGVAINAKGEYNINFSCWDIPTRRDLVWNHLIINNRMAKNRILTTVNNNIALTECVAGCFFLAKTSAMEKMRFLDENVFLYNEENLLGIKCKKAGYKEIVVLDQFYIHNHKHKKGEKIPFKKKIMITHNGYVSRKYLCETYYGKGILPALWCVELLNKIFLALCYFKNVLLYLLRCTT